MDDEVIDRVGGVEIVIQVLDLRMNPPLQSSQLPQIPGYRTIEQLGSGAYGMVFKAERQQDGESSRGQPCYYACKLIKCDKIEEGIPSTAIRECGLLKHFSHPNLVRLREIITEKRKVTLVFEFCDADLKQYIYGIPREIGMEPAKVKALTYQLLRGIHYIHSKQVLHRDLKPQNLLINLSPLVLKVADFGLSRTCAFPTKGYAHEVVTLWYRPPDVLLESGTYFYSIDIWGVGCIFSEMSTLRALFTGSKEEDQLNKIFRVLGTPNEQTWPGVTSLPGWKKFNIENHEPSSLADLHPRLDPDGIDLLTKMLQPDPRKRITASQALNHPYFSDLPADLLELYNPTSQHQEKPKTTLKIKPLVEPIEQQNHEPQMMEETEGKNQKENNQGRKVEKENNDQTS